MAKIMMLLPKKYMLDQAKRVITENGFNVDTVRIIETVNAIEEARKCINEGANIIVARGVQAQMIKAHTNIPVVEITMTAQEIGLLILESKKIIKKEVPCIAIVSLKNMMGDYTYLNKLFGVKLNCYFINNFDELEHAVENAVKDKVDIILGGDHVIRCAEKYQVPTLFLKSTKDSIRGALSIATKMAYAIDTEKNSQAQFETVLDVSSNGIMKIDSTHTILIINHIMEELLEKSESEITGRRLEDELKDIDSNAIESVLRGDRDNYSTSIRIKKNPLLLLVAPIRSDAGIIGAILSCCKIKNTLPPKNKAMRDMYLSGRTAQLDFTVLKAHEPQLKQSIEQGKKYALSRHPVLIFGEEGTEKDIFAQCIHNRSVRANFPFFMINCSEISDDKQYSYLFGKNITFNQEKENISGAFQKCNFGTLYLNEVERLNFACQYRLYKTICCQNLISNNINGEKHYDVRIIAGTHKDLSILVKRGLFRKDLYYSLNALTLKIPPLRERKNDIKKLVEGYLNQFIERYSTHLSVADEAMAAIQEYEWPGNLIQLENFCERLFLTTCKKNIDRSTVVDLLEKLYPEIKSINKEKYIIVYKYPEVSNIVKLLKRYNGNRKIVAKKMGISTTTLWRKMKKYGINKNYYYKPIKQENNS